MKKYNIFILIIIVAVLLLGVGYATVNNTTLYLDGTARAAENGIVKITNVVLKENTNNVTASLPVWSQDSTSISFNVSFTLQANDQTIGDERSATYELTLTNDSIENHLFGPDLFRPSLSISTPSGETLDYSYDVFGISVGDTIPAKTSVTLTVKLTLYPSGGAGNYSGGVTTDVTADESEGVLVGSFYNGANTGDLTGSHTLTPLTISVMNSYKQAKSFSFSLSNSSFSVVDANNNPNPTFQIPAETESQNFVIYIKKNANVVFGNSPQRFNLYLNPSDPNESGFSVGTVLIDVDVDPNLYDNQPPTITSIGATKVSNAKSVNVSWAATDNYQIDHYDLYRSGSQTPVATGLTTTSYTVTNLSNGSYSFRVVAYDGKGNSAERSTSSQNYSWTYTIRVSSCSNCSGSPTSTTLDAGGSTTITLTGSSGYDNERPNLNSAIMTDSVSGDQIDISGSYNKNNGVLTISNISGNVEIKATGVQNCLVKGTKILLANGQTKNIEDIDYDDLLTVWNYNDGTITYEYPLWIEKEKETISYTRITFSDNTHLDIAGNHALYSMDTNRFFNIYDKEYQVGSNVAKLSKNNTLEKVSITKIETIQEDTTYYFVGSTTYYNIFANNILTTDRTTMISNLYGFTENAVWPKEKDELVNNNNLDYSYFEDVLPYYLYKGFRVKEAGFLVNYGFISLDEFKRYITTFIINENFIRKPLTDFTNNRKWMVTTSLDNVNDFNKRDYLHYEGSTFVLPRNNKVVKWYSTSENKYYNPGDEVQIWHGMHFVAIYE